MKKLIGIMVLNCLSSMLFGQDRKVTLSLSQQPINVLFKQIEAQCNYHFIYSNDVVTDTIKVSVVARNIPVAQVLSEVLPAEQLFYQLVADKLIAIGSHRQPAKKPGATSKGIFNGVVYDSKGNGVPFASVGLLESNVVLAGGISNETGNYQLTFDFLPRHHYRLKISSVGFQPLEINFVYPDTLSIKKVVLTEDRTTLKTVSITGTKPLMERKADRYVVNVENSFLANGLNGLEVLQKSPGIWVDNDGSIKIRGSQSVMVMINDVVQRMSGGDLADYLRTLKSEDISKIEIISSPPSEFEASGSGGIIHIILKKARNDGWVGSISPMYRLQKKSAYNTNLSLSYKVKNLYLFGSTAAGKDYSDYIATNLITYPNQDIYSSHTDRYNNNGTFRYQFAGAYDLGKNQSIGLQSIHTSSKLNQYFDTYIDFFGAQPLTGKARSEWFRKPTLNSTTLNYVWNTDSLGSGLKIIADYLHSKKTELNNFSSVYTLPAKNTTYRNNTPNTTNLFSIQADYTKVFKNDLSFKTGLKFASTKRDNEVLNENLMAGNWIVNTNLSNQFIYKEDISMAYASLEKTWKKFSIKGGIRAEHTHMDGNSVTANQQFTRNYIGLFPSVFLSQKLNEITGSSVYFSYSRRLQRPSFADLNPYRLQFDNYLTQLGNPDLTPEYTHKWEAGLLFWKNWSADVYFSRTLDKVAQLANPVANNIIEYQTRNFNSSNEYGVSLFAPVKILKWWNMNASMTLYNLRYSLTNFQVNQTSFTTYIENNFPVKNVADFDMSVYYRSPSVAAVTRYTRQFSTDAGASRRFFNKTLRVRGYVSDIFNTSREKDRTDYLGTTIDFYQKRPTRTFSISLNYTFSSGKTFSNKKIEQSNDDEKRRIGN